MNVNADKFELLELENQIEKNNIILKSLQDLECTLKWLDNTERIEDAVEGNCIRLSLRTYIPKLEDLFSPKKVGDATEPSEVNHELLMELLEGTIGLRNVEVLATVGGAYMAWADIAVLHPRIAFLLSAEYGMVCNKSARQNVLCTMRRLMVKSANKSRHSLEYLDKDETVVAHAVGGVDAFTKVPQGPTRLAIVKLLH
ncbi:PREDICTED: RNA-directed DNA polymerase (reverse mRNAase)-related family [Prunus dulcis]|uniref:PREDICTED: RNA-directed DNA polymerase (Reverse mRNAase)-related family n=1 Tax=Prunus dulcis TaxID=3755 RepID=A0A5E4G2X3_PRUDU|nr:PREDICTED: RNA-directed DNA polymerase (reverse mRNAase)-related family [Prunus dulcis]